MALKARVERLEKADTLGGGLNLTEIMTAAVGLNERLYRMDSQALLNLAKDKSESPSMRVQGIRRLLTRDIKDAARLSLLEMEQAMIQADLKEAQERDVTTVSRRSRLLQDRMKKASERVATYRLKEIDIEITAIQS